MATDLDRPFIINGDDLRIAFKELVTGDPETVARFILGEIAKPYEPEPEPPDVGLVKWNCESCKRGEDGGGWPCDCPVPCGARYCQHPMPAPADWDGGLTGIKDPELDAAQAILDALDGLDGYAQRNIIRYVAARFHAAIVDGNPF
jgi:hypothetical protein